jgi:hypothetical protein
VLTHLSLGSLSLSCSIRTGIVLTVLIFLTELALTVLIFLAGLILTALVYLTEVVLAVLCHLSYSALLWSLLTGIVLAVSMLLPLLSSPLFSQASPRLFRTFVFIPPCMPLGVAPPRFIWSLRFRSFRLCSPSLAGENSRKQDSRLRKNSGNHCSCPMCARRKRGGGGGGRKEACNACGRTRVRVNVYVCCCAHTYSMPAFMNCVPFITAI